MKPTSGIPSVRDLIAEFATIEDRIRAEEARVYGGTKPARNPEFMRLADRERQIMALLRSLPDAPEVPGGSTAQDGTAQPCG